VEVQRHAELLAGVLEQRLQLARPGQVVGRLEVNAHEEVARGVGALQVAELLRVDDVASGLVQKAGHRVDNALGVARSQGQDELMHRMNCRDPE
jgi:hypothetical protein